MVEPTNFVEANALLAFQEGDAEHGRELVRGLLLNEAKSLALAARQLAWECEAWASSLRAAQSLARKQQEAAS